MTKESLEKARKIIINNVSESTIDYDDRDEIIRVIDKILNPIKYEENVKVLKKL